MGFNSVFKGLRSVDDVSYLHVWKRRVPRNRIHLLPLIIGHFRTVSCEDATCFSLHRMSMKQASCFAGLGVHWSPEDRVQCTARQPQV